jgi:hypothetical protein
MWLPELELIDGRSWCVGKSEQAACRWSLRIMMLMHELLAWLPEPASRAVVTGAATPDDMKGD